MEKFMICLVVGLLVCVNVTECRDNLTQRLHYSARRCRNHTANLKDFGGVGDGVTSNTAAFKKAIANLSKVACDGGALLIVPPGRWLTGSFNLTSNFTLYIQHGAVLLASQNESDYPLIDPLPSYGGGRDGGFSRYASLIFGTNLTDVVITGGNGTIDGQGQTWWAKFKNKEINNTRPYLIEIMYSKRVQISNLTLRDSPSWNVHPVYCKDVIIEYLTIIAPYSSPNTDGINPDSCTNTRIRDSYVESGDDCIAVKSGWDQYGIKFGRPTKNLSIKRFTCISPDSAVIALGSEMSGGIKNVRAQNIVAINSQSMVRIKTGPGRGAYVKGVYVRGMDINTMKYIFWMTGSYGSHPDEGYDPNALPNITNINFRDVVAKNVTMVGNLLGIKGDPFTGICISNVTADMALNGKKKPWNCSDIEGTWDRVKPDPSESCELLKEKKGDCAFPTDTLAIDKIVLNTCSVKIHV
ncbi:hypothetical protein CASFOL_023622 [Castilleja foliolosa]|uniref:Polygalacturonase n=1 Tax=Castilleja foliolosa TaxID=1961234 RepID=A0ABD3CL19_9LAMI